MDVILVLNAGSSSIKFGAFAFNPSDDGLQLRDKGEIAHVGSAVSFRVVDAAGAVVHDASTPVGDGEFDHRAALAQLFAWLGTRGEYEVRAIGHRVVHGGDRHTAPVVVTDAVLHDLEALIPLAPLHQPHNLAPIRAARARWPDVVQVACFDTAFHVTQPDVARAVALPRAITERGVRRYGFHGLSYEYIATQLPRVLGDRHDGKVVVAHLGNGASLCALAAGRSVATTMGFSVLDGLVMGTRCGTLDAGVILYLLQHLHLDAEQLSEMLYHRSGLVGVSGVSGDMAVLLASDDPHAAEAIALFVYRIVVEIGALAAALGGLDALVFTAGIGEHAAAVRARVCAGCEWLGAVLDAHANDAQYEAIHAPTSRLRLAVIPTDEERMIAIHTRALQRRRD
jgi:acetate kinase